MSKIILIGSSIIKRWVNFHFFTTLSIINLGISGLMTQDLNVLNLLIQNVLTQNILTQNYIIFYCGCNDIRQDIPDNIIIMNIINFLNLISNNSIIIVISILKFPEKNKKNKHINYVNKELAKYCKKNNYIFININKKLSTKDFIPDNIHLNLDGYNKLNNMLLKKVFGKIK